MFSLQTVFIIQQHRTKTSHKALSQCVSQDNFIPLQNNGRICDGTSIMILEIALCDK